MDAVSIASLKHVEKALSSYNADLLADLPNEIRKIVLKEAREIAFKDVFGADHKKDKQGNPIEQGLGSFDNPTKQSIDAYIKEQIERRNGGPELGYEKNLKKMRERLAEVEAQRREGRASANDDA